MEVDVEQKNFSIKEVLKKYKADVVMIQETKKQKLINHVPNHFGEEEIKTGYSH